jgi:hypothetical protein
MNAARSSVSVRAIDASDVMSAIAAAVALSRPKTLQLLADEVIE